MPAIKNIIFDLCGPIITIDVGLIDKRLLQLGVNVEQPYRKLYNLGLTKRFESNQITTAEFCNELRTILATDISDEQICDAWNSLIVDFKHAHQQLLPKVHNNYRTFMLSNSDVVNAEYFLGYLGDTRQCFDEIFFSYAIGDRKPSENVFKHILAKHNLIATETLFIDDCEKHCIGAKKVGLNTIWLQKPTDITEIFNDNGTLKQTHMKKKIYLAAGCFWGAEHYLKQIEGITFTQVGFANGDTENPTYEQVYTDQTGYAETVLVEYDSYMIPLRTIIRLYFKAIDPTSLNRQGHDCGTRYRTGIYYTNTQDLPIIQEVMALEAEKYDAPLQVEVVPLKNFYPADEYHQDYLDKNPTGYCHLPIELFAYAKNYKPVTVRIRESLFAQQDLKYRDFHSKLMPGIDIEKIIGVRTPQLRKTAKDFAKDAEIDDFLSSLPHQYYDENNLHGFIIAEIKDYDHSITEIDRHLPHIDNWATCDLIKPKPFAKNHGKLLKDIRRWMKSTKTYTIRFGIEMLMTHFLDEDFRPEYLEWVVNITNDEYYVKMMVAWYFATALAKQYEATLPIIEQNRLATWTHNKTIQKAVESYRITNEQKEYLKGLKRK